MSWQTLSDNDDDDDVKEDRKEMNTKQKKEEDDEGWGSDENNNEVFEAMRKSDTFWEQAEYGFGENISFRLRFSRERCRVSDSVDETGYAPWPSSTLLGQVVATQPELFENKTVLELGSGTGIVGLLMASCGVQKLVMTDKDETLLNLIQTNIDLNFEKERSSNIAICKLEWSERMSLDDLAEVTKHVNLEDIDLVIASDVVYPQAAVSSLMVTASFILSLSKKPDVRFVLGYEPRGKVVTERLFDCANAAKLHGEWFPVEKPVNNAKIIILKRVC